MTFKFESINPLFARFRKLKINFEMDGCGIEIDMYIYGWLNEE
jgi:hypothetical protein